MSSSSSFPSLSFLRFSPQVHLFVESNRRIYSLPSALFPAYVVTGSQDSVLNAYLVPKSPSSSPDEFAAQTSNDPNRTMIGHTSNVCCVDGLVGGDGLGEPTFLLVLQSEMERTQTKLTSLPSLLLLVSGSWDTSVQLSSRFPTSSTN